MSVLLFGQPGSNARREWTVSDFVNVDDTVRGGSSSSKMEIVQGDNPPPLPSSSATPPTKKKSEKYGILGERSSTSPQQNDAGSIDFSGFLDTTTLGGAGFASQAYSHPLPGDPITNDRFAGLRLSGRRLQADNQPKISISTKENYPGGGEGPVTSFILNLKTETPKKRPDGRRESQLTYEWQIDLSSYPIDGGAFDVEAAWNDFKPTYRGRPVEDAPKLDSSKVKEWSIMARSDFGKQSGPFAVRLIGLSAVSSIDKRDLFGGEKSSAPSYVFATEDTSSGEYYGFALFIFATVAFFIWILWALTPDSILQKIGIDWYPNREWAFLIPAWSLFAVLFVYVAFMCLNTYNNPDLSDLRQVVGECQEDSHSNILPIHEAVRSGEEVHPLQGVNTMAQTGGSGGALSQDIYEIPPGVISRQRHGLHV